MKNIIYTFIFILAIGISGMALAQEQKMEIYNTNGELIENGANMATIANTSAEKLLFTDSLLIKNISEETIKLKVRKNNHTIVGNTYSTFVALAQSMDPNQTITDNYWELEPGQTLPLEAVFKGTYYAIAGGAMYTGTSTFVYSFLSVDENDQVLDSVYVNYSFSNTSITPVNEDGEYLYNREILIDCDPTVVSEYNILLNNHTAESVSVRVGKTDVMIEDGQEVYFKFGGVQYTHEDAYSDAAGVSIAGDATLEGENGFVASFDANEIDGDAFLPKVTYKFFNRLAGNDADFVTLVYNVSGVGFSELDKYEISQPYPNPAVGTVTIDHPNNQFNDAQIKLYNANGQLVLVHPVVKQSSNSVINISQLTTGVYFMSIELEGNAIGVEKLIVE